MSRQFDAAVAEALEIERELRLLTPDRPSIRCFIASCLARAGAEYNEVEAVKERLAEERFALHSGSSAYIRNITREIASGRYSEPPAKERIGKMYWNQKDEAILELGGHVEGLFLLWVVAAEQAYQKDPAIFGTIEDLPAHKARIAELEARRSALYKKFPGTWAHSDLHIGRITSDGAALITFRCAQDEVPVHPPATAGERLAEHLMRQDKATGALFRELSLDDKILNEGGVGN